MRLAKKERADAAISGGQVYTLMQLEELILILCGENGISIQEGRRYVRAVPNEVVARYDPDDTEALTTLALRVLKRNQHNVAW